MSGIEFIVAGLIACVVILFIAIIAMFMMSSDTEKVRVENKRVLNIAIVDINKNIELLAKHLEVDNSLSVYGDGGCSLYLHTGYEISPNTRINLLMDHLNLEVKEGEPSATMLVKKKPIKKGK